MKKTLLLLFLSIGAFGQVFRLDTTFKFDRVRKQYNDLPHINYLNDSLININFLGNIYNDKPVQSGNLIIDKKGQIIRTINPADDLRFSLRMNNTVITSQGKYITLGQVRNEFTLWRINENGTIDSTFIFPRYKDYIAQIFLTYGDNIIIAFPNAEKGTMQYEIFDTQGKFVRTFLLTDYGFTANARINNIKLNGYDEHYIYAYEGKTGKVIKTDKNFIRDEGFPDLTDQTGVYEAINAKISVYNNMLYIYITNLDNTRNKIAKYDRLGKAIWENNFGKVSIYGGYFPTFFHQDDESLDIIYSDDKHIKILADGTIDSVFYQNKNQEDFAFLHVFKDGTYWVTKKASGIIDKMYADGSIDSTFKISVRFEKTLYPNQIEKQAGNYLVEFIDLSNANNSPYIVRYADRPNCIRIYNEQHKLLYDFFDATTKWLSYKSKDAFIVRGGGKIYSINNKSEISISTDTLKANDVVDWDNRYIYRMENSHLLLRYKIGIGQDKSFSINSYNDYRITGFDLLPNNEILVQTVVNTAYLFSLYHSEGIQDRPFSTFEPYIDKLISSNFRTFAIKNGYLIRSYQVGGVGHIRQTFSKIKNDYKNDEAYRVNNFMGGQFIRHEDDGTIFINTSGLVLTEQNIQKHNFLRILPNGKIDDSFSVMDINNVYGFEFFDENTLYAVGDSSLYRFIKSPEKQYFNYTALADKIVWNAAYTQKLNYRTNISPIRIEVNGNARLENDSMIAFMSRAGLASVIFKDINGKVLVHQQIELTRVTPSFIYTYPRISAASSPYTFNVSSSSGLPVKITVNGIESLGSIKIDPKINPHIKITLKSEKNDQYEAIEETFYLAMQSPLSEEPGFTDKDILYYPNPSSDELFIKPDIFPIDSFQLIGVNGKTIPLASEFIGDKYRIRLGNIPQGVYILSTRRGEKQFKHKIVIE